MQQNSVILFAANKRSASSGKGSTRRPPVYAADLYALLVLRVAAHFPDDVKPFVPDWTDIFPYIAQIDTLL